MSLIKVRNDAERVVVTKNGRFAVPRGAAAPPPCTETPCGACVRCAGLEAFPHLMAYVRAYKEKFAAAILKAQGLVHVESEGFTLNGPLVHIPFASSAPEIGPVSRPKPPPPDSSEEVWRNFNAVGRRFEEAERALAASNLTGDGELVDYELVGRFVRDAPVSYRTVAPGTALTRGGLIVPTHAVGAA